MKGMRSHFRYQLFLFSPLNFTIGNYFCGYLTGGLNSSPTAGLWHPVSPTLLNPLHFLLTHNALHLESTARGTFVSYSSASPGIWAALHKCLSINEPVTLPFRILLIWKHAWNSWPKTHLLMLLCSLST